MTRRQYLRLNAAALAAPLAKRYRVVLIGHTGRGGFGHNWDLAWTGIASAEVVALSDPDEKGRLNAQKRSGAQRAYADYREMLAKEKPDIVTIGVRWADQHLDMVRAPAGIGAHMIVEKPFAQNLPEADAMVEIAARARVKIQVGHAARASATARRIRQLLSDGAIGEIVELRARGKEDARAGGEDLIVLGSHALDLMRFYAADPQWVFAHVTQDNRDAVAADARQGREKVGSFLGNQIAAVFSFASGVHGYFGTKAAGPFPPGERCGLSILGSKGAIFVNLGTSRSAEAQILRSPQWMAGANAAWEPLSSPGPEIEGNVDHASQAMALDLLDAIETNREPVCSARDGRWTIEMIAGIWRSHLAGARMLFPLRDRSDPLAHPSRTSAS